LDNNYIQGWYEDPYGSNMLRYWDGNSWGEQVWDGIDGSVPFYSPVNGLHGETSSVKQGYDLNSYRKPGLIFGGVVIVVLLGFVFLNIGSGSADTEQAELEPTDVLEEETVIPVPSTREDLVEEGEVLPSEEGLEPEEFFPEQEADHEEGLEEQPDVSSDFMSRVLENIETQEYFVISQTPWWVMEVNYCRDRNLQWESLHVAEALLRAKPNDVEGVGNIQVSWGQGGVEKSSVEFLAEAYALQRQSLGTQGCDFETKFYTDAIGRVLTVYGEYSNVSSVLVGVGVEDKLLILEVIYNTQNATEHTRAEVENMLLSLAELFM